MSALAGADDWEVGPCVNHLGNVTSWDINVRPQFGDKGVVVIASVYSGEVVARAILAAIQTAATEARRASLTRMVQLDEEMGLYDDAAFTSGPWEANPYPDGGTIEVEGGGCLMAVVSYDEGAWTAKAESEANARLIAAAPDLYEALAVALSYPSVQAALYDEDLQRAVRAIAKASAGEAGTAGTTEIGPVHEHATAESGDAQTPIPSSRERK